jgi:hypothetical protein
MLYEEDHFHPNNNEDRVFEDSKKKVKANLNMYFDAPDNYECKISSRINGNKKSIKCYKSVGRIRNAITGVLYDDKVGSSSEDLYFKVKYSSVEGVFFYDGPQDFERHMFLSLDPEIKSKWNDKVLLARRRLIKNNV